MFDPVLNQATKKELLRQRREQENPSKQRRHGIKLRDAETVGNKSNHQAQRDRNREEHQEIRQSGAQDVAVGFETVSDVGHPIPHSKRDDSCVDREKLRKRVVQVRTRGCNQDSANNPKLQRQPYPQNNQRFQPQTASHVSHRPESDKRNCQVYRHRDQCHSAGDVHADGVHDIQQPQSRTATGSMAGVPAGTSITRAGCMSIQCCRRSRTFPLPSISINVKATPGQTTNADCVKECVLVQNQTTAAIVTKNPAAAAARAESRYGFIL